MAETATVEPLCWGKCANAPMMKESGFVGTGTAYRPQPPRPIADAIVVSRWRKGMIMPEPMTEEDLSKIDARVNAVAQKWSASESVDEFTHRYMAVEDAAWLMCRQDVPLLLAEVRRLRGLRHG